MDCWKSLALFWALWGAGIVVCVIGFLLEQLWLEPAGVVLMLAAMVQYLIFYRCPSCGRHLGRGLPNYCPHCGEKLK